MTDFGINENGFNLKRLADILTDMKTALSNVTDPVTGESLTPDLLDENDPLIQIVNTFSDVLALSWEQLQLVYNQFDPLKATGAGLSGLVQLNKLTRRPGSKSTVVLTLTGAAGKTVPAGKIVTDMDSTYQWILPAFAFDGGGSATVTATASDYGPLSADAGTLVKIVTPYSGWTAVTNALAAVEGSYEETDTELRIRQQDSTATGGATVESIYTALAAIEGVTFAHVYQNITDVVDARGIPAHQIASVVMGGDDTEIGTALFNHIPAGVATYGTSSVTVTDAQGIEYIYYFTRPSEIDIYIEIEVEVVNASLWPDDSADQIKAAIIAYATEGRDGLGIPDGFDPDGYPPGQSVYASEQYTPINSIQGHRVVSVYVGTSPSPSETSVSIDWDEIAIFDSANINITVS